jgi:hypothetical protein
MRKSVNVIGNVHGLENISGTLWEHFRNPVGSLWEVRENQGIMYSVLYKYNMVCDVVHALYCTCILYCINILYCTHILYTTMKSILQGPTPYFYTLHSPLP